MFRVAVPDIARDFALFSPEVNWVMTACIVVFAADTLTCGKLGDVRSVRNLVTAGLVRLKAGSAPVPSLFAARLVQAAGGASTPSPAIPVATRYLAGAVLAAGVIFLLTGRGAGGPDAVGEGGPSSLSRLTQIVNQLTPLSVR